MAQVTVRVGGYTHPVSCEDGQEGHLIALAADVDRRVSSIRAMGGQFGESRLLLLTALLLADELHDLRVEMSRVKAASLQSAPASDPLLAERLGRLAERIEGIAASLDRP
ncbi:cell division protein ZapA [Pseudoroseomonas rhizosphaerae]|uniref:Cell division protein ZapA n=1 Tax=Teichococcus rhizosphaerae TaxID=1335062 RepID=A0A2C6Y6V1_9PROT|nr:cell division protein ZapA [Pseudoroseomonas rhizosphaerae]PHK96542.1 cell division protein ZapA [Pseudoroseomonas rhizosphaerae]